MQSSQRPSAGVWGAGAGVGSFLFLFAVATSYSKNSKEQGARREESSHLPGYLPFYFYLLCAALGAFVFCFYGVFVTQQGEREFKNTKQLYGKSTCTHMSKTFYKKAEEKNNFFLPFFLFDFCLSHFVLGFWPFLCMRSSTTTPNYVKKAPKKALGFVFLLGCWVFFVGIFLGGINFRGAQGKRAPAVCHSGRGQGPRGGRKKRAKKTASGVVFVLGCWWFESAHLPPFFSHLLCTHFQALFSKGAQKHHNTLLAVLQTH
jgi:hypothetical protein